MGLKPAEYTLPGFNVASLPPNGEVCPFHINTLPLIVYTLAIIVPHITPTNTPLLPDSLDSKEIVLFVGYPAMGKSTFYRKHFEPAGYIHVNQDTLRTRDKCLQAVEETLQDGKSCVVGR